MPRDVITPAAEIIRDTSPGARSHDYIVRLPAAPRAVSYRRASEIDMRPVSWLWPARIARGKVSLIAGMPGLGKSQITASMAAIVTTGVRWPVDRTPAPCGNVIILSAEDDADDTITPRLVAAGADLERAYVIDNVRDIGDDGRAVQRTPDLTRDLAALADMIDTIGDVAMIVIDPVTAYCGGIDTHRTSDVRGMLAPLAELAREHATAVICVSHLRKDRGDALRSVTGSLAWVAAARAMYIVARDPNDETRRLMLPAKNNLGEDRTGLAYSIEAATVGEGIATSRVSWHAEAVTVSADDALSADAGDPAARSERNSAADWLADLLAAGPLPAREVRRHADEAGYAWRTLHRARDAAGVTVRREGYGPGGQWMWSIDADRSIDAIDDRGRGLAPMAPMAPMAGDETIEVSI